MLKAPETANPVVNMEDPDLPEEPNNPSQPLLKLVLNQLQSKDPIRIAAITKAARR